MSFSTLQKEVISRVESLHVALVSILLLGLWSADVTFTFPRSQQQASSVTPQDKSSCATLARRNILNPKKYYVSVIKKKRVFLQAITT